MTFLLLQTFLLMTATYLLGAFIGCMLRRVFHHVPEVATTHSTEAALAAGAAAAATGAASAGAREPRIEYTPAAGPGLNQRRFEEALTGTGSRGADLEHPAEPPLPAAAQPVVTPPQRAPTPPQPVVTPPQPVVTPPPAAKVAAPPAAPARVAAPPAAEIAGNEPSTIIVPPRAPEAAKPEPARPAPVAAREATPAFVIKEAPKAVEAPKPGEAPKPAAAQLKAPVDPVAPVAPVPAAATAAPRPPEETLKPAAHRAEPDRNAAAASAAAAAAASVLAAARSRAEPAAEATRPAAPPPAPAKPVEAPKPVSATASGVSAAPVVPSAAAGGGSGVAAQVRVEPMPPADRQDLTLIRGIDTATARALNERGIWRYRDIAGWKTDNVATISRALGDAGRIARENWIEQAAVLAGGAFTDYARRRLKGENPASAPGVASTAAAASAMPAVAAAKPAAPAAAAPAAPAANAAAASLAAAPASTRDDLTLIRGIDAAIARLLDGQGIRSFADIARWRDGDVSAVNRVLGKAGRVEHEGWIAQAAVLAGGGMTEYARRRLRGELATSAPAASAAAAPAAVVSPPSAAAVQTPPSAPARPAQSGSGDVASLAAAAAAAAASAASARVAPAATAAPAAPAATAAPAAPAASAPARAAAPAAPAPVAAARDDLTLIRGIDEATARLLQGQGIARFADIAKWKDPEVAAANRVVGKAGRVEQEGWIEQAAVLAGGGLTDYAKRRLKGEAVLARPSAEPVTRGASATGPAAPAAPAAPSAPAAPAPQRSPVSAANAVAAAVAAAAASGNRGAASAPATAAGSPAPHPAPHRPPSAAQADAPAPAGRAPLPPAAAAPAAGNDLLQRIRGIDSVTERLLLANGVTRHGQIAAWTPADIARIEGLLGAPGRVGRENWVEQAQILAQGTETAEAGGSRPARLADAIRENAATRAPRAEVGALRSVRSDALRSDAARGAARPGSAGDDLKRIRGIGVLIEKKLNALGIDTYEQVASWTADDIEKVSQSLDFRGRIERENWIEQARILAAGGHTEFSRRLDRSDG